MRVPPIRVGRHRAPICFVVILAFGVVVVSACGLVGLTVWNLSRSFDSVEKIPAAFPVADAERPAAEGSAALSMNFLLLGSDSRGAHQISLANLSGARSDTIMVLHRRPTARTCL